MITITAKNKKGKEETYTVETSQIADKTVKMLESVGYTDVRRKQTASAYKPARKVDNYSGKWGKFNI